MNDVSIKITREAVTSHASHEVPVLRKWSGKGMDRPGTFPRPSRRSPTPLDIISIMQVQLLHVYQVARTQPIHTLIHTYHLLNDIWLQSFVFLYLTVKFHLTPSLNLH